MPRLLSQGLELAWAGRLLTRPALRPEDLVAKAERREDGQIAPGHWQEALERLTADLEHSAALNPLGRAIAHGQIVRLLRQRLRAQRLLVKHPAIADRPLRQPLIIVGHMRSGTTRLHRMLACDPRFSFTRLHETLNPLARSSAASAAAAWDVQAFLHACNPRLRQIHPAGPLQAEEEFGLHAFSFHGAMFEAQWNVPEFARWDEGRDLAPVYAEFRQLLQILGWRRGDGPERIPLLKAPQFLEDLDAVFAAFPDARIVRMERDLDRVVASGASLIWNQRRIQSDWADPADIGAEMLRRTKRREERAASALRRNPQVPLLTVEYDRMSADWPREVERIYAFLGLNLGEDVRRNMQRIASATAHQGHRYSPENFGLSGGFAAENGGRTRART